MSVAHVAAQRRPGSPTAFGEMGSFLGTNRRWKGESERGIDGRQATSGTGDNGFTLQIHSVWGPLKGRAVHPPFLSSLSATGIDCQFERRMTQRKLASSLSWALISPYLRGAEKARTSIESLGHNKFVNVESVECL